MEIHSSFNQFKIIACIILALSSCKVDDTEWIAYDHKHFHIQYPDTWVKLDKEDTHLSIKRYDPVKAIIDAGNPNIIIASSDSAIYAEYYEIPDFEAYLNAVKNHHVNNPEWQLIKDLNHVEINGSDAYTQILLHRGVVNQHQTRVYFKHLDQYVFLFATYPEEYKDDDIHKIIRSLQIPKYEPMENLFSE
ncbi:MAG: hypothetical protein NXI20_05655 [bacterium]|nr:hypothetical protein [bacterium]